MKYRTFIFLSVLSLALLAGCFYTDSEVYYVDPLAGDPPLIHISTNLDTLVNPPVNDSLEVSYLVEIVGGELYYVNAQVASSLVYESDSIRGSFWVTRHMADSAGIDTLHMKFYYSTNSNSLADNLGYEANVEYLDMALDFNPGGAR